MTEGNIVGTASIKITADASGFQADLDAAVRKAIQAVEADLKVGLGLVPGTSGGGASERPAGPDDASMPSVTAIEDRQGATSSAHNLAFNISGLRGAIEEALKAPFVITFEARGTGTGNSGDKPEAAKQTYEGVPPSVATGSAGAQTGYTVPQGVMDVMKRNTTLTSQLVELHRNLTRAMASAGKPVSSIDPEEGGREAERLADLTRILGTNDPRMWMQLNPNDRGTLTPTGRINEVMKEAGVPVATRGQVLESARPLFYGGGKNEDGTPRKTGGSIYDTRDQSGKGSDSPSFVEEMTKADFSAQPAAARPIEPVRMAAPLAELAAAAAQVTAAPSVADPNAAENHAAARATATRTRQEIASSIKEVHFGRGIAGPEPYAGGYQRPETEVYEEVKIPLSDAEKKERANRLRKKAGWAQNPLPEGHKFYESRQAAEAENEAWLNAHPRERTELRLVSMPEVTGERGDVALGGGRPVLGGGLTPGRDPGRDRSPRSGEAATIMRQLRGTRKEPGLIGRIESMEKLEGQPGGPTKEEVDVLRAQRTALEERLTSLADPSREAQRVADQIKTQQDYRGGGGGRVRGPGLSQDAKNKANMYSDARLRMVNDQGIGIDLAPFVREVQRGGQGPWFGTASGEGGAFQIPLVYANERENPDASKGEVPLPSYEEMIKRQKERDTLAASKRPVAVPQIPQIKGKVVPISRAEAIRRMAMDVLAGGTDAAPGGDSATRDLIDSFLNQPGTKAAINAALDVQMPGPDAGFSGDTAVRSSNPQKQAKLDYGRAQQEHLAELAAERLARAEAALNASEPGSKDQDVQAAKARRAEADRKRALNRAADLTSQGAMPISGTLADARRMAAVDAAVGTQTRDIVDQGLYADAHPVGRGEFGDAPGQMVPRLQGRQAREQLAGWFGLPSINFDEGAGAAQINKAEREQMMSVLGTALTGPFAERLAVAEHRPVPDVGAKDGMGQPIPNAMRPETLYELSKRLWKEVTAPIDDLLAAIPKGDKEGQKVGRSIKRTLDSFFQDLYGTVKFLDETNDQYETTREMASNRGGGPQARRRRDAGAGPIGSGGRGASAEMMERSRVSTFFHQAEIPVTSLDIEAQDALSARNAAMKSAKLDERLNKAERNFAETTPSKSHEDLLALQSVEAEIQAIKDANPVPRVSAIRTQVQDLIKTITGELGGSPDKAAVSSAIASREGVDDRVRQEAIEALEKSPFEDPNEIYSSLSGVKFMRPRTRDTSLPVESGDQLRRARMKRDGTLVGELPETPTGADLGYQPAEYFVPGAQEVAAKQAEIDAQIEAIRQEKAGLPLAGPGYEANHARWQELNQQEQGLWQQRTLVGQPVVTNPVPGEEPLRASTPEAQAAVDQFRAQEAERQGISGNRGGNGAPPDRTGTPGRPSGDIIRVWVENPVLKVEGIGGGGDSGGPRAGANDAENARNFAAWTRAQAASSVSPRMLQFAQQRIDRLRADRPDISSQALLNALSKSGLAPAAEVLLRDEIEGGRGAGGSSTINALGRKLGVSRDARMISSKDREEADQERARLSAEQRVYQERILSRGFTASVTNLIQGRFFADQQEAVNRFAKESSDLAKARNAVVSAKEDVGFADSVVARAQERFDSATPKQRPAAQRMLNNAAAERERLDLLRQAKERDAQAQERKVDEARTGERVNEDGTKTRVGPAVPSGLASFRNLAIGSIAAAGAFGIGSIVYQIAGEALGLAQQEAAKQLTILADRMMGFANTAGQVGSQLSDATRQMGGNAQGATASLASSQGMNVTAYEYNKGGLEDRALMEAGNKNLAAQIETVRASRYLSSAGGPGNGGRRPRTLEELRSMDWAQPDPVKGAFQPAGGISGLTRATGGFFDSGIGGTPSTINSMTDMLPGTPTQDWISGGFPNVVNFFESLNTALVDAETRYKDLIPDEKTAKDFEAQIKSWNTDLERAGSGTRLFTKATEEQTTALGEALRSIGTPEPMIKRWQDLGIGMSDAEGKPIDPAKLRGPEGAKYAQDLLESVTKGAAVPSSEVTFAIQEHALDVQMDALQAQTDLAQRSRMANFGMGFLAQPPISPSMQILGAPSQFGPAAPEAGIPSAMNASIPDSVLRSWDMFGQEANSVFAEIHARAAAGIDQLKNFGLNDTQITKIKTYGEEIKNVQERLLTNQTSAFWQDYNRGLELGKRQLGDMLGLLGKQSQQVKGVGDVQATNLGQQERIVLLKSRELTLLGQELQQRQISFQTSLAGFMSEGLTPEEIAARQEQAKYVAGIAQQQLNLQKDITGASFQIVDEQNLRGFQQAMIDLEKIPRDLTISIDTKWVTLAQQQIGALRDDTVAQAGIIVSEFQGVESAAIQMAATVAAQSTEAFNAVFNNAQNAIAKIAPEYKKMLDAISNGGTYVPDNNDGGRNDGDASTLRNQPYVSPHDNGSLDTGGPGSPTGSYSGATFAPTVNINVGAVGSPTDVDDIVRAVERALNQKSSLYGLRAPVAS